MVEEKSSFTFSSYFQSFFSILNDLYLWIYHGTLLGTGRTDHNFFRQRATMCSRIALGIISCALDLIL